ncbi:hypothetical protein FMUND_9905 [Fusarium mundagurra]|uniref:Uncharacterized protein n=1 Tax=Fusarium mundagurra TaxID=1567541 RepID=A0A8H5YBU9_9HYPO|nr:hypothetical protein FMUND_9905 [Fusarium mundagurra]
MNPKHVTYPMRFSSHGEEEIPMFLQSVTHMECSPYWYRFFVKKLPPRPWPLTINGRPFTIALKTTEDLPLTPIPAHQSPVAWSCPQTTPIPWNEVNVCSGVLIKNQKGQRMMTTAARIVRPGEVVGMREFFLQNRIGLAVGEVLGTDVALVRLDWAIDYKNQDGTTTFTRLLGEDPDDALPWNSIVSLATRWPPSTKGIIVAKSVKVLRHPATTHYRVYHWAWTGQPGNDEKGPNPAPRDTMIGAAAINETGVVTGLLYSNERRFRAGYSVMLSANELVDAGYSLVT